MKFEHGVVKLPKKEKEKKDKTWWFRISKKKWFNEWKELTPTQRSILLSLWLYGANKGHCHPSLRQLSADLNISYDTIWRNIKILEKKKYFKIKKQKGRGRYFNKYFLLK